MDRLLILGAGGHGVNCLEIARQMGRFSEIAFLDDGQLGKVLCDCPVIGGLRDIERLQGLYTAAFVAFGNNEMRERWMRELARLQYGTPTLVSPRACVSCYAELGAGSVVFPFSSVEPRAKVGEGCILSAGVIVNHDAEVHAHTLIYSHTVIRPYSIIGDHTTIGSGCIIGQSSTVPLGSHLPDGTILAKN